ncbi:MAG TPA: agarase [Terriglobia bacterium]|nr:agarase [Terriglobia bacterium]
MRLKNAGAMAFAMPLVTLACLCAHPQSNWAQQGFFQVEKRAGVWWLIWPDGAPSISVGVDTIRYQGDPIRRTDRAPYLEAVKRIYPDRNAWESAVLSRLTEWGFNTVGAWSDPELWKREFPYTVILDIAGRAGADWEHGKPVDVYAPRFETTAQQIADEECRRRAQERFLVGYFSDNELRWGPDWRGKETMLEMYLKLPSDAMGRQHAVEFLRQRYGNDIGKLNRAWEVEAKDFTAIPLPGKTDAYRADAEQFLAGVAERYFQICAQAIHEADSHHLYLGARFAGKAPDVVFRAAHFADVASINIYGFDPSLLAERLYKLAGKPVLITEFAFRAQDSGLPNTQGAGPRVPDQAARAKAYADYVTRLESLQEAIGYHWFQWSDEPKEGRFDGENSNYGLVSVSDMPYAKFVAAVKAANAVAIAAHKKAVASDL